MIKEWYAINVKTGESAEAMEPISLKQFLDETGFGSRMVKDFILGPSKENVRKRLNVPYL